ncbi:MAG: SPASM domain-containing protein, partial [bacterium]|nr:SPASM domain-containing protein [bacterium]
DEAAFIRFLKIMKAEGIWVCAFTKTSVFADDERCLEIHGCTSRELAEIVAKLDVTVLVGFNAIDWDVQEKLVVSKKHNYACIRNKTLELLAEVGLNKTNPSRLGLGCSPMTHLNVDDMVVIYTYARPRNLSPIITTTMCVGPCKKEADWRGMTPFEKLPNIYAKICGWNIEHGIWTLDWLRENGIPPYPGMFCCKQIRRGACVKLNGDVTFCPGSDKILGNVVKEPMEAVLARSPHFRHTDEKERFCPAKCGKSLPDTLQTEVMAKLEKKFR